MTEYEGLDRRQRSNGRRSDENGWHVDKRVPLALIFMMIVQTVGVVFFAGVIFTQVGHNSEAISKLASVPERIGSLEAIMQRVEHQLDNGRNRRF